MKHLVNLIFKSNGTTQSLMILFARMFFGVTLLQHGIDKIEAFGILKDIFPDPVGWGSLISLCLVIFAEVFCSLALIIGFMQRLALIPIMISMSVAFFVAHGGNFAEGELALIYLFAFISLFIGGAGKFSVDHWFYINILNRIP